MTSTTSLTPIRKQILWFKDRLKQMNSQSSGSFLSVKLPSESCRPRHTHHGFLGLTIIARSITSSHHLLKLFMRWGVPLHQRSQKKRRKIMIWNKSQKHRKLTLSLLTFLWTKSWWKMWTILTRQSSKHSGKCLKVQSQSSLPYTTACITALLAENSRLCWTWYTRKWTKMKR